MEKVLSNKDTMKQIRESEEDIQSGKVKVINSMEEI
jgi:hypothetical protein